MPPAWSIRTEPGGGAWAASSRGRQNGCGEWHGGQLKRGPTERKITIPKQISGYVADEPADLIDEIADHHDISRNRVLELLLREGVNNRHQRIKIEHINIKVERGLREIAVDTDGEFGEEIEAQSEKIGNMPLPEGTTGVDLVTPHPYFGGDGWYHDPEDHPYNQ